eukprot:8008838-Pyramimonas_sp.AAC.1
MQYIRNIIRAIRTHPVTETSHNPEDDQAYVMSGNRLAPTATQVHYAGDWKFAGRASVGGEITRRERGKGAVR